ncbi:transglycosylase SLT domain-containing protein [Thiocystis violacea]|uniref:transglycosylase SLT domain-containing protein n=1 Tax=Thiocystis violacea TaxID=13725 RepID=UPI001903F5B6|nr:transglycosylase SLT domain-containing protein [Thiocystis violacea]MBK1716775.1 lytic murein transglycosylase [Thiocystis violacea]
MLPLVLVSVFLFVAMPVLADQDADFLAAEAALKRGDREGFERLSSRSRDHPLYPYLVFAEITTDLKSAPDASLEDFLATYADTPLAERLRLAYLRRLSDAGRWADYARIHRPDASVERRCLYLRALMETGREAEAMPQVETLWLSGRSRPNACDPVFERWSQAGHLTTERIWKRIRLTMEAGQSGLARHLGRSLPESDRDWLRQWLELDQEPSRISEPGRFETPHPQRAAILAHGLQRLARQDPIQAAEALERLKHWMADDPAARERAYSAVGRGLAAGGDRLGLLYWDALVAGADNLPEQERRLRAAIGLRAWDWLAKWIAAMPDGEEKRDRWLYWQGRAEEFLGQATEARATLELAARQRSFWGFMAADRIGQPYNLSHRATPVAPERVRALTDSPAYRRINALHRLDRETDVRREWRTLARDLDADGLMAAAHLADQGGWHDQAILMLARSGYWDDLEIRFPLAYRDLIGEQAWRIGIDADWIHAVLRQESVFARAIASPAGAIGLMQLMPATAAEVAATLGLDKPSRWALHDPELNIALGSTYLTWMRDRFGHPALATAAYNAGPRRVRDWLPSECTPVDLWIARIPFDETRAYVERVMAYRIIYADRLGLGPTRLSDLLPPIPAADFWLDGRVADAVAP